MHVHVLKYDLITTTRSRRKRVLLIWLDAGQVIWTFGMNSAISINGPRGMLPVEIWTIIVMCGDGDQRLIYKWTICNVYTDSYFVSYFIDTWHLIHDTLHYTTWTRRRDFMMKLLWPQTSTETFLEGQIWEEIAETFNILVVAIVVVTLGGRKWRQLQKRATTETAAASIFTTFIYQKMHLDLNLDCPDLQNSQAKDFPCQPLNVPLFLETC